MKKLLLFLILSISSGLTAFANVHHFNVELSKEQVKVWEALDLTIKAVDEQENVVTDFTGSVIVLSDTDFEAKFPWVLEDSEQTYTFLESDAWEVKFENSVVFSKEWEMSVSVFSEESDDIWGQAEIIVTNTEAKVEEKYIEITSPESLSTITQKNLTISWSAEPNHKIIVDINGEKVETQSNTEWNFFVNLEEIESGEMNIIAEIYDAEDNLVGATQEVSITVDNSLPKLISASFSKNEVMEGELLNIEIIADKNLDSVSVVLNDVKINLEEWEEWTYTAEITAPNEAWEYNGLIELVWNLNKKFQDDKTLILNVKKEEVKKEEVKEEPKQEENPEVELNSAEELLIKNIKVEKFEDHSVMSWDKVEWATGYNIYKANKETRELEFIDNIEVNSYTIQIVWDKTIYDNFYIKAVKTTDWVSEEITDYSKATKVQTWPTEVVIILFLSLFIAYMIARRKRAI